MRLPLGITLLLPLLLISGGCRHANNGTRQIEDECAKRPVREILWDTWGIPHVFAGDEEGLFYAFGWAQAKNHADLLLRLYGQARGRAAEYWGVGPQDRYLKSDTYSLRMGIPARARRWHDAHFAGDRMRLASFAAGINAYAAAHPSALDPAVRVVLPVTAIDVLAHVQRVTLFHFVANPNGLADGIARWGRGGSNAWAVGPRRSASGAPLLLLNPHLPWGGHNTWFEAHLTCPTLSMYGAALVGFPYLGIGFNDALGWTHTVNTHDGADLYELKVAEGGYTLDGKQRPLESSEVSLLVKQPDGSVKGHAVTLTHSVHGPVVAKKGERALALRVAGLDAPYICPQYWDMARAQDLESFEAALRHLQSPTFTVLYADREGHILHLFGGRTPVRPAGPWDWRKVVPGDRSSTLWHDVLSYEQLPRVLDPPSGWLQNANDPPWTTTFPRAINPAAFPPYVSPRFMHLRAQRSVKLLAADKSITLEELIAYKHDTRLELADRFLDPLLTAAKANGTAPISSAVGVLEAWDRSANASSRGAVLFKAWRMTLGAGLIPATPWSPDAPLITPRGLKNPALAVRALADASKFVKSNFGRLDVAWGEVHRVRHRGQDLPANGASGSLGCFRTVEFAWDPTSKRFALDRGETFVAAVEFSRPVRARALLPYGNASQPGSTHAIDQLPLFIAKELRPVWRTRAEILEHLETREDLSTD